jgi:hypothetical protein
MVVVEGHLQVPWITIITEVVYLGKKVEGIGVVLLCSLFEKFNRFCDSTVDSGLMGLRWGGCRTRWNGFKYVTQSGSDESRGSSLSAM